jgi:hypothetical protein
MSAYKVTFISDYFVLYTTVDSNSQDDDVITAEANQFIKDWCGFAPEKFSSQIEIEEA